MVAFCRYVSYFWLQYVVPGKYRIVHDVIDMYCGIVLGIFNGLSMWCNQINSADILPVRINQYLVITNQIHTYQINQMH